ncbi:hypothetical protein [Streptomyces sp. NPDC005303]|uniref:hypothetical protein n=1 Tax=Streptomyces sp. NPDC005303 TaxID=3155713 RepID=UPI0033B1F656
MDALVGAIAGLIGVIVGVAAQSLQAGRGRRWQVDDQKRASKEARADRLWQERRVLYARCMESQTDAAGKFQWTWLTKSALPPTPPAGEDSPLYRTTSEAQASLPEAIKAVTQCIAEVLLITESEDVMAAVNGYLGAMQAWDPSQAHRDNPSASSQGIAFFQGLMENHKAFVLAARQELQLQPASAATPSMAPPSPRTPPSGPSSGRQRALNDDQR